MMAGRSSNMLLKLIVLCLVLNIPLTECRGKRRTNKDRREEISPGWGETFDNDFDPNFKPNFNDNNFNPNLSPDFHRNNFNPNFNHNFNDNDFKPDFNTDFDNDFNSQNRRNHRPHNNKNKFNHNHSKHKHKIHFPEEGKGIFLSNEPFQPLEKSDNRRPNRTENRPFYQPGNRPSSLPDNRPANTPGNLPPSQSDKSTVQNSKKSLLPGEYCGLDVPKRIIGGTTADIDEFPWLGLLEYVNPTGKVTYDCSGVLISKRYVLTAAHCTHGISITSKNLKLRKVRLGEWDISTDKDCQGDVCSSPVQEADIEEIIPHEKYKPRQKSQANDIALIRLRKDAQTNAYVQPICLPFGEVGNINYEGKKLTVSGWGRTSNARGSNSNIKMKVEVPVVNWDKCRQFYQSFYGDVKISQTQFCAGGESGKDSCQGDSGGPLMTTERVNNEIHWYMVGIVSSGPAACGVEDRPSLYTNVSQYTDWILNNLRN